MVTLEVPYPESLKRSTAIFKLLFGLFYVILPHGFVLMFVSIGAQIAMIGNWFIILFTGKSNKSIHDFLVGFIRWNTRVNLYMMYMTDRYPPFTLDAVPSEMPPRDIDPPAQETSEEDEQTS